MVDLEISAASVTHINEYPTLSRRQTAMAPPPTPRRVVVQPLQELRIELEADEGVSVRLLNGTAEIFGHELASGLEWPLTNECRAAVFTWTGCEIEMSGQLIFVIQHAEW